MVAFAMVVVSRCAASTLCPTDGELKAALYARVDKEIADYAANERRNNPDLSVLAHPIQIRSVRNVHCGSPAPSEPQSINCSFTAEAGNTVTFETAKLAKRNGEWVILDELTVTRRTTRAER